MRTKVCNIIHADKITICATIVRKGLLGKTQQIGEWSCMSLFLNTVTNLTVSCMGLHAKA
jgi:hypothetical protein